ncbi:MAG: RteC domain-containing protein [Paludibacter sp.]|nr:RteC domain-containing protein [Paludibacter sp.]
MKFFSVKLSNTLNSQLKIIDLEEKDSIQRAQKSIVYIRSALGKLKTFIMNYTFKDEDEEILFFKEIKPGILSQLIYFIKINNIESKRPMGSIENQQKYLLHELEKLTVYFNNHLEFYRYYRMNSTFLDEIFFLRGKDDLHLHIDNLMIYIDPDFSTSQDYMVAKIMANDRLEVFLKSELETLSLLNVCQSGYSQIGYIDQTFQWSDSKTALTELIYALYEMGSITKVNNSRYDIRELTAFFEQIFNIRLTDVYRTFIEIKGRATPTKYIDNLRTILLRKIEEED